MTRTSKYDDDNNPWVRRFRCQICTHVYRYDLSAEDGGPKELIIGHCNACTSGLVPIMRELGMIDGSIMGMSFGKLGWVYNGGNSTYLVPNEHSWHAAGEGARRAYMTEAKTRVIKRKEQTRKKLKKGKEKRKAEVDDFLDLAGL